LRIPLPLVQAENMTYSNYESATLKLYDNAVIPTANRLFSELSYMLLPRYPNTENLMLAFEEGEVLALEPRRNEQLKILKDLGIFTINQLRDKVGAKPLDGGDVIYGPSMNVPIATDITKQHIGTDGHYEMPDLDDVGADGNHSNQPGQPIAEGLDQTPKASRETFINIMRCQINKDGTPRYNEEEIAALVREMYANQ
jgi:hypothetical protein